MVAAKKATGFIHCKQTVILFLSGNEGSCFKIPTPHVGTFIGGGLVAK